MYFPPKKRVYPAHVPCEIELIPQGPVAIDPADEYILKILPFSGLRRYSAQRLGGTAPASELAAFPSEAKLNAKGGALRLALTFPQEDRWLLRLYRNGAELESCELYSLEADLFALTPYKGDCHMHSYCSDGKDSPEYMVAAACRRGYDYCALTDHRQMAPSIRARAAVEAIGDHFLALSGEEIHAPGNNVHIINMGGEKSVNEWHETDPEGYESAVRAEMANITEPMGEKDKWATASCQAVFAKIHEYGGVAVLCHPGWVYQQTLQQSEDITNYLFDHRRFDALELIAGGAFEEGTQLQISYYQGMPEMPVLGNSDAHQQFGGRLEPGNFTVTFAESLNRENILDAVRKGYCVAGHDNKFFGSYRLVKYVYFLKANIFDAHDALSAKLGVKLMRYASAGADPESRFAEEARACANPATVFESLRYE